MLGVFHSIVYNTAHNHLHEYLIEQFTNFVHIFILALFV